MGVIKVKFDREKNSPFESKEYAYFCDYAVSIGDRVIVESPYNGYVCVTVSSTAGHDAIRATKEVVNVVDDRRYRERIACRARLAEISAELERAERDRINRERWAELEKSDPNVANLLREADDVEEFLRESRNTERFAAGEMFVFDNAQEALKHLAEQIQRTAENPGGEQDDQVRDYTGEERSHFKP